MPRQLIKFIVIFIFLLLFVFFNLNNRADVSFGFVTARDIPVFFTVFISFILGMLCTLPFVFKSDAKKKKGEKPDQKLHSGTGSKQDSPKPGDADYLNRKDYGID